MHVLGMNDDFWDKVHELGSECVYRRDSDIVHGMICLFLENCQVGYVLFEAATALKEAVIREWNMLEKQDIDSLCAFLLNYITQQKR